MRTVCCSSRMLGACLPGGCLPARGCLPRGGCLPGGVCLLRGVCPGGSVPLWTERQTLVKILLCRNYVADDKKPSNIKLDVNKP